MRILKKTLLCCFIFLVTIVAPGFSQEPVIRTKYFNVYYDQGCDLTAIVKKLNANYFLHVDILSQSSDSQDMDSIVSRLFDSIYLEVCDILDIHVYSFHAEIRILSDKNKMIDILEKFLGSRIDSPSYYFQSKNTIYFSYGDFTLGILSHEIAHAIISHYFVVAPPPKVQEVLSGYVEYSIRKATGDLTTIEK